MELRLNIKSAMEHINEKIIYFIRHGESVGNAAGVFQGHDDGLSPKGVEQAHELAKRFLHIPVEVILASTMARARETAEIIHEKTRIPVEFSDLLIEVKRPSEVRGKPQSDEAAFELYKKLRIENHEPTWRYADEENFSDRVERACKVIKILHERAEKTIIIVSHGTFLRTILACMAFGANITPQELVKFVYFLHKANTGISICKYKRDGYGEVRWKLRHWNDIAHLGE